MPSFSYEPQFFNVKIDINVNSSGLFCATVCGTSLEANTLPKLKDNLKKFLEPWSKALQWQHVIEVTKTYYDPYTVHEFLIARFNGVWYYHNGTDSDNIDPSSIYPYSSLQITEDPPYIGPGVAVFPYDKNLLCRFKRAGELYDNLSSKIWEEVSILQPNESLDKWIRKLDPTVV